MQVTDNSPQLKRGNVKDILIQTANDMLPAFEFLAYKRNCYTFQRLRCVADITVYEAIHIVFSLKHGGFACSIASRLNATLIFANAYNGGFINPHKDLKLLKYNTGIIPAEEAYYLHNGHLATTTNTIREIFNDYKNYGLPFLDKQYDRIQHHPIVTTGINYIKSLNVDKPSLKKDIYNFGYIISNIKHPLYIALKEKLQDIPGQSREDRKDIPRMAYDLLEWYFSS
jgi:hypothetical protein